MVVVAATAALAVMLTAPTAASAGTTLISRNSVVSASSELESGMPGLEQSRSVSNFARFAEQVGTGDVPENGMIAIANQYSVPGLLGTSGAGLEGAFAEGHVKSAVSGDHGASTASTAMELHFEVEDQSSDYIVGAAIGAYGGGVVKVELAPVAVGAVEVPVFAVQIESGEGGPAGASKTLNQSGSLFPGQYLLRVQADAFDAPGEAVEVDAYFNFNFQLSDVVGPIDGGDGGTGNGGGSGGSGGPGTPAAVPLPPAVFAGGGMLAAMAISRLRRRR